MDWRKAYIGGHVNPGWVPLVDELHRRISQYDPNHHVHQVKEKFGRLRYYYDLSDDVNPNQTMEQGSAQTLSQYIRELVDEAEMVSGWICEVCGKPGHTNSFGSGWLNTLCPEHAEIRKKDGTPAWKQADDLRDKVD